MNSRAKAFAIAAAWRGFLSVAVIRRTFAFDSASTWTLSSRSLIELDRARSLRTLPATASEPASSTFVAASRSGSSVELGTCSTALDSEEVPNSTRALLS